MSNPHESGSRLERALELFLQRPATEVDGERLLTDNPDLRDLLLPMVSGQQEPCTGDERVLGDFRLVREHGSGGMGIVYEAWQRSLDRRVAVKVLSPSLVQSPAAIARFRREAGAAGRLRHPNIVEVIGFGSDGGQHFFAMQFVDGESLHDCKSRFADPRRAVDLVVQLVDALAHAHEHGLVHRDVKPANVLLGHDDTPMLTDFGIASDELLPTLTLDGGFVGTLDYASPEQVRGERIDARTDLWAVGVMLYELLAGAHPFSAATQQATLHNILSAEPPALQRNRAISSDLAAVVGRMLEKDRTRRYDSAKVLLDDLRALQRGAAVSARLPTAPERAMRWARREPWRAAATMLVAIGLPALTAALGYLWANAPRIKTAAAAEAASAREEVLAEAWTLADERQPQQGLLLLDKLRDPADEEVALSRALLLNLQGRTDEARKELRTFTGDTADLLQHHLSAPRADIEPFDGKTLSAFACFVRSRILMAQGVYRDTIVPRTMQRATEAACLAVTLSPSPRLSHMITWLRAADLSGDRSASISAERALAQHFPDSPVAIRRRAQVLCKIDATRALELLADPTPHQDAMANYWLLRGVAHETLRQYDESVAANQKAVSIDPDYQMGWSNLGAVLRKHKDYEASVQALRRAIELRPTSALNWNSLGLSLRGLKQTEEAQRAFEKAIELQPDYGAAAYNLGNLQMGNGDAEAAVRSFELAVRCEPGDAKSLANLGDALLRAGRKEEALAMSVRAAVADPDGMIPNYNVASIALELGLVELSLKAAEVARDVDKKGANGLTVHVKALLAQPKFDAQLALREAREADRRLGGKDLAVKVLLARALEAAGERDQAIRLLEGSQQDSQLTAKASADERADLETHLARMRAAR